MNKVILLGRLTKDPDIKYSDAAEPLCIAKFGLAVPRKFKKQNETNVDFINCIAFGKSAEFIEKFFTKGQQVSIIGRIQTGNYTNKEGQKIYTTDVIVEEQYFADSKKEPNHENNSNVIDDLYDMPF